MEYITMHAVQIMSNMICWLLEDHKLDALTELTCNQHKRRGYETLKIEVIRCSHGRITIVICEIIMSTKICSLAAFKVKELATESITKSTIQKILIKNTLIGRHLPQRKAQDFRLFVQMLRIEFQCN